MKRFLSVILAIALVMGVCVAPSRKAEAATATTTKGTVISSGYKRNGDSCIYSPAIKLDWKNEKVDGYDTFRVICTSAQYKITVFDEVVEGIDPSYIVIPNLEYGSRYKVEIIGVTDYNKNLGDKIDSFTVKTTSKLKAPSVKLSNLGSSKYSLNFKKAYSSAFQVKVYSRTGKSKTVTREIGNEPIIKGSGVKRVYVRSVMKINGKDAYSRWVKVR